MWPRSRTASTRCRTTASELIAPVEAADPATRFNDGEIDPQGRFWAGTMAWDAAPQHGSLYRLDTDGTVTRMLEG